MYLPPFNIFFCVFFTLIKLHNQIDVQYLQILNFLKLFSLPNQRVASGKSYRPHLYVDDFYPHFHFTMLRSIIIPKSQSVNNVLYIKKIIRYYYYTL